MPGINAGDWIQTPISSSGNANPAGMIPAIVWGLSLMDTGTPTAADGVPGTA